MNYWQIRALSEQAEKEEAQAQVLQQQARETRARLAPLLEASGMGQGRWRADDTEECFVRIDGEQSAAPPPPAPATSDPEKPKP